MSELINALGLDWRVLIAQLVNFSVLVVVLYFLAYKPLLKYLNKRSQLIEASLKKTEKIDQLLAKAENDYAKKMATAQAESEKIMSKSQQEAEKYRQERLEKTRQEVAAIVAESRAAIESDKKEIIREVKEEMSGLVAAAATQVLRREIKLADDERLIRETVTKLKP
jgi:F-type H+-transporting ATPase subunit b